MIHLFSRILVVLALLVQVGVGALPAGQGCVCIPMHRQVPDCCAHRASAEHKPACRLCGSERGPESCICVPTLDSRATPTAGPRTVDVPVEVVAAPILTPRPVLVLLPRSRVTEAPEAHESPPGLPVAVNRPLLL